MNQRRISVLKTHRSVSLLQPSRGDYARAVFNYLLQPFVEDIRGGDVTTRAVFPGSRAVTAKLLAKQPGVLAGMQEIAFFLGKRWAGAAQRKLFGTVKLLNPLPDGAVLKKGTVIAELTGDVSDILRLERSLLNFLQHMCGVATLARMFVQKSGGNVLVCPTRKTPWGLLDKRACLMGGAGTHRLNLSDAILVKDTHLDLIGHDFAFLGGKLASAGALGRFVEIETESVSEGLKAANVLVQLQKSRRIPCFVMLDNMKPADIKIFVGELRSKKKYRNIFTEASGGITLKNIRQYARTGVDVLSVGAMTHSAPALDISLKILPAFRKARS